MLVADVSKSGMLGTTSAVLRVALMVIVSRSSRRWRSPYAMGLIAEEATRAGRGARVEVTMPLIADDVDLAVMQGELARLGRRGVEVSIRRDEGGGSEA